MEQWSQMEKVVSSTFALSDSLTAGVFTNHDEVNYSMGHYTGMTGSEAGDAIKQWQDGLKDTYNNDCVMMEKLLDVFICACEKIDSQVLRRRQAVKELSYYQGKYEKRVGKGISGSYLKQAEKCLETQQEYYDGLTNLVMDNMKTLVEKKHNVFQCYQAKLIETQYLQSQYLLKVWECTWDSFCTNEVLANDIKILIEEVPEIVLEIG
eukprot:Pgem_evm1s5935